MIMTALLSVAALIIHTGLSDPTYDYDFGVVSQGVPTTGRISLTNTTRHTWVVAGVSADCGCIQAWCDKSSVPPGEALAVHLRILDDVLETRDDRVVVRLVRFDDPAVESLSVIRTTAIVTAQPRFAPAALELEARDPSPMVAQLLLPLSVVDESVALVEPPPWAVLHGPTVRDTHKVWQLPVESGQVPLRSGQSVYLRASYQLCAGDSGEVVFCIVAERPDLSDVLPSRVLLTTDGCALIRFESGRADSPEVKVLEPSLLTVDLDVPSRSLLVRVARPVDRFTFSTVTLLRHPLPPVVIPIGIVP